MASRSNVPNNGPACCPIFDRHVPSRCHFSALAGLDDAGMSPPCPQAPRADFVGGKDGERACVGETDGGSSKAKPLACSASLSESEINDSTLAAAIVLMPPCDERGMAATQHLTTSILYD